MSAHPAIAAGRVAVVTGAASGIGLAAARRFASFGLKVALADLGGPKLDAARTAVAAAAADADQVHAFPTDVSRIEDVRALYAAVEERLGVPSVLMNNAAIDSGGGTFENYDKWRRLIDVNLFGVINGVQTFTPAMIMAGAPALIINTGSKQGITTPPGNAAYNVSKAGVKVVTEQLAHELREQEAKVTAHLLIPGFTYTGLTKGATEKPADAWTADQVVDFMLDALDADTFYILCPDNAVPRATDEKRMRWAMDDIIKGRPALSRWHKDYKQAFDDHMKSELT